jgi:hypothetical protein
VVDGRCLFRFLKNCGSVCARAKPAGQGVESSGVGRQKGIRLGIGKLTIKLRRFFRRLQGIRPPFKIGLAQGEIVEHCGKPRAEELWLMRYTRPHDPGRTLHQRDRLVLSAKRA